ncbi:MAG: dephospho-CoA kinase [Tannerellaceae bacterium]|jgi:dephospho-CoA kinase|nr:dephospho-CoA kinase [Tannerellaceae bacterium]
MIKIGLTGGIGSGKSVVAVLFGIMGIPVYMADEESKQLTQASAVIREGLIDLFGERIYPGGVLDKNYLASLIFTDAEYLRRVNAIIHPEVNRHFLAWAMSRETALCAIETAILFESGFDKSVDVSVMVYAPLGVRIQRVTARDNTSYEEVARRVKSQLPDETKKERSDYVIYNDGKQALIPQVEAFLRFIRRC